MNDFTIVFSADTQKPDFNDFFERLQRRNAGRVISAEMIEDVLKTIDIYFEEMIVDGFIDETLGKSLAKFFRQNVRIS